MERQGKMEQDQQRLAEALTAAQKKLNDEKRILIYTKIKQSFLTEAWLFYCLLHKEVLYIDWIISIKYNS